MTETSTRLDRIEATLERVIGTVEKVETQLQALVKDSIRRAAIEEEREPRRRALAELPARVERLEAAADQEVSGVHRIPALPPVQVEAPPARVPAIVQVMDHPQFRTTLLILAGAVVAACMAVAGTLTWADVQDRVPRITVEGGEVGPVVSPPFPAPAPLP